MRITCRRPGIRKRPAFMSLRRIIEVVRKARSFTGARAYEKKIAAALAAAQPKT